MASVADENWPPQSSPAADTSKAVEDRRSSSSRTSRNSNSSRRSSVQSPYVCKLPVCSSASSEEGSDEQAKDAAEKEEKEEKRERRRNKVKEEILLTEETYQQHLQLIVKYFKQPYLNSDILPPHVIHTIFSNIEQIININRELSDQLHSDKSIGQAFLDMAPFLKLYSTYANNHETALATLMEWEQKLPEASAFRRSQEDEPEMGGLKLNALLITPVQRVPRYKMLLEELLQYTPLDDADYKNIQDACRHIGAVAQHINEHIKQQDNANRMLAIQKSLAGPGPVPPNIITPGRMFIKDGPLKKVSKKHGRSLERMFFLFSDILMYAKPKLLDSQRSAYVCCCIMPLQHCMVARVLGTNSSKNKAEQGALFTVSCKSESLLLYSDQKTVDSWISTLTKAIGQLVKNKMSLRKDSSVKTPLRRAQLNRLSRMDKSQDQLQAAMSSAGKNSAAVPSSRRSCRTLPACVGGGGSSSSPGYLSPRKRLQNVMGCLSPRSRIRKKKMKGEDAAAVAEEESFYAPTPTLPRRSASVGYPPPTTSSSPHRSSRPSLVPVPPQSPLPESKLCLNSPNLAAGIESTSELDPESEIHCFEGHEEDEEEPGDPYNKEPDDGVSLSKSDLLSLFAAADAMESGHLQSHLHTYEDSSLNQSVEGRRNSGSSDNPQYSYSTRISVRTTAPATTTTTTTKSVTKSASAYEDYDYNNYAPRFAHKYRSPMTTSRVINTPVVKEKGNDSKGDNDDDNTSYMGTADDDYTNYPSTTATAADYERALPLKKRSSYIYATTRRREQKKEEVDRERRGEENIEKRGEENEVFETAVLEKMDETKQEDSKNDAAEPKSEERWKRPALPSLDAGRVFDAAVSALDTASHVNTACTLQ